MTKSYDYDLSKGSKLGGAKGSSDYNSMSRGNRNNGGYGSNNWGSSNNVGSYTTGGVRSQGSAAPYNNNRRPAGGYQNQYDIPPTAPYNFVKLNEHVVAAPLAEKMALISKDSEKSAAFMDFITSEGKYSGYFDVTIKNKTPLYIGSEDGFFSDGLNYFIPGSSLRGCLKNTFKMITCSSFRSDKDNQDLSDRHLYFRTLAVGFPPARKAYAERMSTTDEKGKAHSVAQGGFLVREKNNYYIIPADVDPQKGIYVDWHKKNPMDYPEKEVRVYVGVNATPFNSKDKCRKACVRWHNDSVDVFTGPIGDKKKFYRFSNPHWNMRIEVPKEMIEDYRNDESRGRYDLLATKDALNGAHIGHVKYNDNPYLDIECIAYEMQSMGKLKKPVRIKDFNIDKSLLRNEINSQKAKYYGSEKPADNIRFLKNCSQYDRIIPCFYTAEGDVVTGFGASPYFRIPYRKAISDHIPAGIKGDTFDFTDAVFGNKGNWASRVYFEDLFLAGPSVPAFETKDARRYLSTANPTSFQMYLETKNGKAAIWEEETNLRGYKLYWHKNDSWKMSPLEKEKFLKNNPKNITNISPLKVGHTFKGRIRFENLDKIELGAMCSLFTLGKENDICYKLGGGKSIGMGTVNITASLVLQDEDYYTKLFDDKGFALCQREVPLDDFKKLFDGYMAEKLNAMGAKELGLYKERMQELRLIMSTINMQKPDWNNQTRYMGLDGNDKKVYSNRTPLPSITEVYNKVGKGK